MPEPSTTTTTTTQQPWKLQNLSSTTTRSPDQLSTTQRPSKVLNSSMTTPSPWKLNKPTVTTQRSLDPPTTTQVSFNFTKQIPPTTQPTLKGLDPFTRTRSRPWFRNRTMTTQEPLTTPDLPTTTQQPLNFNNNSMITQEPQEELHHSTTTQLLQELYDESAITPWDETPVMHLPSIPYPFKGWIGVRGFSQRPWNSRGPMLPGSPILVYTNIARKELRSTVQGVEMENLENYF